RVFEEPEHVQGQLADTSPSRGRRLAEQAPVVSHDRRPQIGDHGDVPSKAGLVEVERKVDGEDGRDLRGMGDAVGSPVDQQGGGRGPTDLRPEVGGERIVANVRGEVLYSVMAKELLGCRARRSAGEPEQRDSPRRPLEPRIAHGRTVPAPESWRPTP